MPEVLWARGTYGRYSWPRSIPSACSHTRTRPGRPSCTPLGAGRGNSNRDSLRGKRERHHHPATVSPCPVGPCSSWGDAAPARAVPGPAQGVAPRGVPPRQGAIAAPEAGVNDARQGDGSRAAGARHGPSHCSIRPGVGITAQLFFYLPGEVFQAGASLQHRPSFRVAVSLV